MGFWDKSRLIFTYFCDHSKQSVRRMAQHTGLAKIGVYRLGQAMARRNSQPESGLWGTKAGRRWCIRLVVATLYIFGLKRGVGLETMSEFFARLHLERQMGCSPSALQGVMHALEAAMLETAGTWEHEVRSTYRHSLETLSLSPHPVALLDSTAQTSDRVERRLQAAVEAIETLAECHQ